MINKEEYFKKLNSFEFYRLKNVKVGEALSSSVYAYDRRISILSLIRMYISIIFFQNYKRNELNNSKIMFIFTNAYSARIDHLKTFRKFVNLFDDSIFIQPKKAFRLSFFRWLRSYKILIWFFQMRIVSKDCRLRLYLSLNLYLGYDDSSKLYKIIEKCNNLKVVTTFCDIHSVDYLLTYKINARSPQIKTVTVQHGHFISGWQFSFSHSNYFLVHGKMAQEFAVNSGKKLSRVKPVGLMQSILSEYSKILKVEHNTRVFGVVLNGVGFEYDNEVLIETANQFSKAHDFKYILRLHPSNSIETYINYIDEKYLSKISDHVSISEFSNEIDFALLGKTTVFIELHLLNKPCFRLVKSEDDFFGKINYNSFSNYEEFIEKWNSYNNNGIAFYDNIEVSKNYMVETDNVRDKYYSVVMEIIGAND